MVTNAFKIVQVALADVLQELNAAQMIIDFSDERQKIVELQLKIAELDAVIASKCQDG